MLTGSIVALITPMDEKGRVCQLSLKRLIDYHITNGTTSIVSVGITGEAATLSYEERRDIIMMTIDFADGRIPIIANTSANSTNETIRFTNTFENSGVAGCLVMTPCCSCPTQEGLFQHFKAVAEHTTLPQILYNVPFRTGCDLLPKTIGRLANIKNIIGIKEATGDLSRVHQIKELVSEDFILLSGNDATALDFIHLGGHGVISVTANIAAYNMAKICKQAISGNLQYAYMSNKNLMPLHKMLFIEPNPIPVKWACKKLGLIMSDSLRLPMTPITNQSQDILTSALENLNLI